MTNTYINFILTPWQAIPDSMWIAAEKCIDCITSSSGKLLAAGLITQLLLSGLRNIRKGAKI